MSTWVAAQNVGLAVLDKPLDLTGEWRFKAGDDLTWADPRFDDRAWQMLYVPKPWGRQGIESDWGWYRLKLELSDDVLRHLRAQKASPLAVTLGEIQSAYELYVNGELIGGLGQVGQKVHYGQHKSFVIPTDVFTDRDDMVVALRVWRKEFRFRTWSAGPYGGPFLLAPLNRLELRQFKAKVLPLVLTFFYLIVAFYHLYLYHRVKTLRAYGWYGLMTLALAAYTFFASQWKFDLGLPFLLIKKIEHALLYIIPALVMEYSWQILGFRVRPLWRLFQLLFVLFTLLILLVPNLTVHIASIDVWAFCAVAAILLSMSLVLWRSYQGDRSAQIISWGALVFMLTAFNDLLFDWGFIISLELIPMGFAALVLMMSISLANQFTQVFNNLEFLVEKRTKALELANAKQKHLLADIVHDVTTPLSVVMGYTQSMQKGTVKPSLERMTIVNQELKLIDTLVQDLRLLSTLDAGELKLEFSKVSANDLLTNVATAFAQQAETKGVDLRTHVSSEIYIDVDQERMKRVLMNLLSNALRHTPQGGVISLTAGQSEAGFRLDVQDTGVGASEEQLPKLFERFYRVDESRGETAGSGLGLAIAKSIVELHKGSIFAQSAKGQGMTISINLPLSS